MKKILALLLTLVFVFSTTLTVLAQGNSDVEIMGLENETELSDYASNVYLKHLHALIEAGELTGTVQDYSLGQSFTVFNVEEKTNSTCFPVLHNKRIVAILDITKIQGEYTSSLSVSFAKELEKIFTSNEMSKFILITDGVHLQAFDGIHSIEVFQLYDDGGEVADLSTKIQLPISELPKSLSHNDITSKSLSANDLARITIGPSSYKTINVRGVSQGNHPWCWAATCAALTNYYKGTSLTAANIANYVFPENPEQGGTWNDMKKAYNHWNLYPSQTGRISFSSVKSQINANKPMHLGLVGHSVGLIGYEDWVGSNGGGDDQILILLEPNGGVQKSVTLTSSGNFTYSLGGGSNAWQYTRTF